jgi:hypothetical protein
VLGVTRGKAGALPPGKTGHYDVTREGSARLPPGAAGALTGQPGDLAPQHIVIFLGDEDNPRQARKKIKDRLDRVSREQRSSKTVVRE